jgi:HK97 family phage major capsid protein
MSGKTAAAEAAIKTIDKKISDLISDEVKTVAEKAVELEKLQADAKENSDLIAFEAKARQLMSGTGANGDTVNAITQAVQAHPVAPEVQFTEAEGFKEFAGLIARKQRGTFSVASKAYEGVGVFQTGGNAESFNGTAGTFVVPQALPGYVDLRVRPLTVENVLPSGTLSSPVLWYIVETVRTNNAAAVAEGGLKPQGTFDFERRQEVVSKIAETFKLADEVLTDVAQLRTYINQRLTNDLGQVAQEQILNGDGASNRLLGLNNRTGLQTTVVSGSLGADGTAWATALLRMITKIRTIGFTEPNAIFINPMDFEVLQNQTDNNGQYFNGGPYGRNYGQSQAPNVTSFWGIPLVSTLTQPQGTATVGNFNDATVWNYQGITMDLTNSDGTDFVNDIVTFRAERRLGLSLIRPLSIGKVTLTA